jgi:2-polyprenyl-3-methyl-5-hydroxy-6-metoxy-1,4-benzoquinol methylase
LPSTHLNFYLEHGISPVHYAGMEQHFERRASLYRTLGLLPLAFRGARTLEVAAGSGQNSLYVASLMPESLTLLEPNPTAIEEIKQLYAQTEVPHTPPLLVESTLQDYIPPARFDIVLCENWLGRVQSERLLLRKLAGFLAQDGVMVLTTIVPTGFLPNLIRRALAIKYSDPRLPFAKRTEQLLEMFEPHLGTIGAMTRCATDWVQDNMINPAYFDICLSIPDVLHELGAQLCALGTNPSFSSDWRWFKELHGAARNFNQHMLHEYQAALHNFMDYQLTFSQPDLLLNCRLEASCLEFLEFVREYERVALTGAEQCGALAAVTQALERIVAQLDGFPLPIKSGLTAGLQLLLTDNPVAEASPFSRLFGRETVYFSLTRVSMEIAEDC